MNHFIKKFLLFLLFPSFLLVGCSYNTFKNQPKSITTPQNTNQQEETTASNQASQGVLEIDTSDWLYYENREIKISLYYPPEWGNIDTIKEIGCGTPQAVNTQNADSCEHIALAFSKFGNSGIFLATQSKRFIDNPIGRDGYWGDNVGSIKNENYISQYCEDRDITKCSVYRTRNNILVVRSNEDLLWEGIATMYRIKSPNHIFPGIILSTIRLQDNSITIEDAGANMNEIVESLTFL